MPIQFRGGKLLLLVAWLTSSGSVLLDVECSRQGLHSTSSSRNFFAWPHWQ